MICNKKIISCVLVLLFGSFSISSGDSIVVFNEIMYHPATDEAVLEWVEFYNQLSYDMDISGWSVRGGIEYDFPEGTIVPGGGFLVLAISPAAFQAEYGYVGAYGPFTGRLSNAGEEIRLLNNSERIMDVIDYRDGGDWPVPPDGSGVSLSKIDSDTASEPPENWTWSEQIGGTPGEHNFSGDQPVGQTGEQTVSLSGLNDDLVGHWPLDNDASDIAGGNDGVLQGGPSFVVGIIGSAIDLNGTYQTVLIPHSSALKPTNEITISAWVKPDNITATTYSEIYRKEEADRQLLSFQEWGTVLSFGLAIGGVYVELDVPINPSDYTDGDWHLITATYDGSYKRIYADGVQIGLAPASGTITNWGGTANAYLGSTGGYSEWLDGKIDDFRFYSRALDVSEIEQLHSIAQIMELNQTGGFTIVAEEGQTTDSFTIALANEPDYGVTIELVPGENGQDIDLGAGPGQTITRNFTTSNWSTPKTITVQAVEDTEIEGDEAAEIIFNSYSSDPRFNNSGFYTLSVTVIDNDFTSPPDQLVINEVTAATESPFWVEIFNPGEATVDLTGFVLACAGDVTGEYNFPAQSIERNNYLVINESELGFHPINEDKLFLYKAGKTSVFDGRTVKNRLRGRSMEHNGRWLYPSGPTSGSANSFDFHDEIVINEIMYHRSSTTVGTPATYETTTLIPSVATAATLVPTDGSLGLTWTGGNEPFNDSGWTHGTGNTTGIGYDTDTTYDGLINTDLEGLMNGKTCFYTRIAFSVTDPQTINALNLKMKYDDGFVAYINGVEVEVARRNLVGETPAWNSTAYNNPDGSAVVFEPIDISAFISVLQPEQNILAIHGINSSSTSSDLLILPELEAKKELTPFIPRGESPEAWVELYNKSGSEVNLTGWKIRGGIEFDFPADTVIPAGGYLVVADDAEYLQSLYPGLTNIIGDFSGNLSHRSDLIMLKDANANPADEVLYFDEGRWPNYADGYSATLELRDPRADNSKPEAWAASDEAVKTEWKTYTYRETASASRVGPDGQWHELVIGLLQEGELLLDDISVIEDPSGAAIQLIQNGSFETTPGDDKWRIIGNHRTSQVIVDPDNPGNHVLHFIATGPTEHMHNHAETTFANGQTINNGLEYEISFRAKWLGGTNKFHTRLYFNRLPKVTMIDVPELNGTPGTQNSRYESNIGPTFSDFGHSPVVPSNGQTVTVSVVAQDPDGLGSCTLWWAVDGAGWNSQSMVHQGDGFYTCAIPGQPGSTVVQFYVEAMDGLGAISTYPAAGMDSRALYKVYDGQSATNGLHNFRIIMISGDAGFMHTTTNLMSNERLGGTIVYNDQKSYYDVGVRLRSSQRGRITNARLGFNVRFNADELFQGVHRTVAIDRSEVEWIGQREMLFNLMMNHAGGQISKYSDLIKVIAPLPQHTCTAELQLARFRDPFLDAQFDNGSDGTAFEYELIYYPLTTQDGTREGLKRPAPDNVIGTAITDLGDDKENYRWNFLIKNNRNWDDYDALMTFAKGFGLSGASFNNIVSDIIDVDQWLRSMALGMLDGCGDNFVVGDLAHNAMFYVRPEDQRVLFFPHDLDRGWVWNRPLITNNIYLRKIIAVPAYERLYYGHVQDILATSYNGAYMSYWTDLFGSLLPGQNFSGHLNFINVRSSYISGQLASAMPPELPFQITTNGGADFIVDSDAVTLAGDGWINVRQLRLSGSDEPLDTTWTDIDSWQVTLQLNPGENNLTLEAYDFQGNLIGSDRITVTSTLAERPLRDYLRVTELMYDPVGGSDYEYIELCNTGPETLDVSNVFIADGVDFNFATSTLSSLLPGDYVVIVSDIPTFESRYGTGINIAGKFTSGKLSNDGEHVELRAACSGYDTDIFDFTYNDSRGWPLAADGPGHSLVPVTSAIPGQDLGTMDYGANWRISTYINGSPGQADPMPPATVVINEIMAHTDYFVPPHTSNDWIELYNPTDSIITLTAGDWYLSDDKDTLTKWAIPTTVISAYGRVVFDEVTGFHNPITEGFGLNKSGEEVVLSYLPGDSNDRVVDAVKFKGQEESVSLGRYPDGDEYWGHMTPTPDVSNSVPIEHIVISEIMYNPLTDASEYVELYNTTASPITLYDAALSTGWRLDGAVEYSFASGVTIPADEYLLVVDFDPDDPALLDDFEADYGNVAVQIFGPYSGILNNRGERLALEKPQAPDDIGEPVSWVIVDEAIYFYQWPWPVEADGTGESLQRFDTVLSGNDPDSWVSAECSPGRRFVFTANFDGYGNVDLFDFAMFSTAWMSQEGERGWDPIYNIAEPADTIIDIKDLIEFAKQWLK